MQRRSALHIVRRGQALAEFAVISLVLFALLAVTLEFGRAWFVAQQLQSTADLAAREFALRPTAADANFEDALAATGIYREESLVIRESEAGGFEVTTLDAYFSTLPVINRQLRPLMFFDTVQGERVLRYPGALVQSGDGLTVQVPVVTSYGDNGQATIEWHRVVEPIGDSFAEGFVQLRINYPYQATTLYSYRQTVDGNAPIEADDSQIIDPTGPLGGGTVVSADPPEAGNLHTATYSGEFGLGRHYALARTLRPFREVLSAQAIYRREIFE